MAEVLVLVEHAEGALKKVSAELITAARVLAALAESATPAGVLLAATADGKEIAGRLAARIGSGLLVDVVELQAGPTAVHSIFGGAFTVQAQASGDTPVITVRAGAIDAEPADGAGEQVTVEVPEPAENAAKITGRE